jgi:hypothetical protein
VLLHRVRAHLPQGPRLQAQAHLADGLLRLLGEVQVQVHFKNISPKQGGIKNGDFDSKYIC